MHLFRTKLGNLSLQVHTWPEVLELHWNSAMEDEAESDAERKCKGVSSLQCIVLRLQSHFCQEPFEIYLLDQVFFLCELGWRTY